MQVEEPRSRIGEFSDSSSGEDKNRTPGRPVCSVVVFAAGMSTRFGRNKLMERMGDSTMICHVVSEILSSRAKQVIVVGGYEFEALQDALEGLPCEVVYNEDYTLGLSFSVKKGLSRIDGTAEAVLFQPGDMPLTSRILFDAVIEAYVRTGAPIVSAGYRGRPGHPILFSRSLFEELKTVNEATRGLKKVVSAHRSEARLVETSIGALFDLDTPYDLSLLKERKSDPSIPK